MQSAADAGLLRQRRMISASIDVTEPNQIWLGDKPYINFSSNDYLGLSQSSQLIAAMAEGAKRFGVGSGASPLVTGYSDAHRQLEQALCEATGHEAALLFCSGFSANSALMKTLFGKAERVVADKLVHASLIDGLRESGASLKRFAHNDIDAATAMIAQYQPQAVVTESVFSMDGDCAPLTELYRACQSSKAWLIVDDAHGFGILPNQETCRADASNCDVQIVTFGKALGCQGAAVLASRTCIDFLVANARHYIYSTALSPANAYVAFKATQMVMQAPKLSRSLADVIHYFKRACQEAGVPLTPSVTPIQPIVVGELDRLDRVASQLKEQGLWIGAIRPPTVPKGSARLRITLNINHSQSQIDHLVATLSRVFTPNLP
ncbi:8-amino-7-oxononanoate synthase [Shewanella mesophila]|uniref:8-amino-7-oxononanoate synthase n=1 Tax=Shewanella mesophila TaxID=2864208 RepID=UPI001C6560CC|nr:8-amino-7-oxononanoate synthase [Shewanella mesophila]QYJ87999.1 8-amino-7-oxononanoate synthase [Shewanella mesophila]